MKVSVPDETLRHDTIVLTSHWPQAGSSVFNAKSEEQHGSCDGSVWSLLAYLLQLLSFPALLLV